MPTPDDWHGLQDPDTGALPGDVMRPGRIQSPRSVRIDGSELVFEMFSFDLVTIPGDLLDRFFSADSDEKRRRLARRFGPLRVPDLGEMKHPGARVIEGYEFREALAEWRLLQERCKSLAILAARLREDATFRDDPREAFPEAMVPINLRQLLVARSHQWGDWTKSEQTRAVREIVRQGVSLLAREAGLTPTITVTGRAQRFELELSSGLRGTTLLSAIAGQLIGAVLGRGYTTCSACGNAFLRRPRQPTIGKRRYCSACGATAARRLARLDYNRRRSGAAKAGLKGESW